MTRGFAHRAAFAGAACALLVGCAAEPEGAYPFRDGWRRGEVVAVMRADEVPDPDFWTCLSKAGAAGLGADRVVIVSYRQSGRRRRHLTRLPSDVMALQPEERVLVNVGECRDGLVRRED